MVILCLNLTISLCAAPGDEHWDTQFGAPGAGNVTYAIAEKDGVFYVAGAGSSSSQLSVWDGKQWSVTATFTGSGVVNVNDLAFAGNTLYAAGNFTNVNGVAANGLAKWNGTNWSSLGFSGVANALAVEGNNVYVGGSYTNAGGVTVTNIGYWDGSAWNALGSGVGTYFGYSVQAVAVKSGVVYVGGLFRNCGSQSITNLAAWNGSTWSEVGGGVNWLVYSLAFNGNDLYVGGAFTQAGTTPASGIAKWDGSNWSALGSGLTGGGKTAYGLANLNGLICVAGSFTNTGGLTATNFATWNGSSWSAAGHLNSTGYRALTVGGKVYVGGIFTIAGGLWANQISSWDGSQWRALWNYGRHNGLQNTVNALASDGTNIFAGGLFICAGQTIANYIARFDGTNWQPLGAGMNERVVSLAATNNMVYAGGFFTGTKAGLALPYFGSWNGTNWISMGGAGGLVYAVAVGPNGVYAAGTYYTGSAYGAPFFNRWNGTAWNSMIAFAPDTTFFSYPLSDPVGYKCIAIQGNNVYLGGNIMGFTQFDPVVGFDPSTNCQNIIRFDGTYGWIMGTGLNKTNVAMAVLGSTVFAAGNFTTAGGVPANQIAKWDGNSWAGVGGGVVGTGTVLALATMGSDLYAGGTFTNMGGVPANRIAKWNGTTWSALGSGVSGSVQSLAAVGSNLYLGGNFKLAGNKSSSAIARWNENANFNIPQLLNPEWPANGPFRVRLSGISGQTNIIQASTNLVTWTPVLTNTSGIYDFTDPNSSSYRARFYRALLAP